MNRWMTNLPVELKRKPLHKLCIPGSHDSGAYKLNVSLPVGHDQNYWKLLHQIAKIRGVKTIIKNWSETQTLSIKEQLNIGVRYFDLRIELVEKPPFCSFDDIFAVHALYGESVPSFLNDIKEFLDANKEEVVILDVNHIFRMSHVDFLHMFVIPLQELFGRDSFCPIMVDIADSTLEELVETNHRLIVVGPYENQVMGIVYSNEYITSHWPNLNSIYDLIAFMRNEVNQKKPPVLNVLQGMMTARLSDIIRNLFGNLREDFGLPSRKTTTDFINSLTFKEKDNVNIVITDEVDENFTKAVVKLNTMLPDEL
ncbi:unnamed protein product [Caenorhabditis bovis]|uniref:Phosphatidylinositol-specific phospholipase C X domain-containing protein n=1 Tax=Caenorhabditis bovis TaxID=2654633 RepID=A0A8S1ELK6_9PELO|nr:unnamed protein product [Caenorhabditis bovis]